MKIGYLVRSQSYGWDDEPDNYEYPWELRKEHPGEYSMYDVKKIVYAEIEED